MELPSSSTNVTFSSFGYTSSDDMWNASQVLVYSLAKGDIKMEVLTLGAAIKSLHVPDKTGAAEDVVLGFDDVDGYTVSRHQLLLQPG